jgi:hypothetical protein
LEEAPINEPVRNEPVPNEPTKNVWANVRIGLYILGALILFLFSLDLMTSSLQHLGRNVAETILLATSNPFTGLFLGLLITAMLQSSSTTTSMAVALVASGSITLQSAVPIIMGANIGTTITSTIVSLGFISKRKEFRRAVAAGTYHDFFNILTATILFPLEYYYGFLSSISLWVADLFFSPTSKPTENVTSHFWSGFGPLIDFLLASFNSPFSVSADRRDITFYLDPDIQKINFGPSRSQIAGIVQPLLFQESTQVFRMGIDYNGCYTLQYNHNIGCGAYRRQKDCHIKGRSSFHNGSKHRYDNNCLHSSTLNSNTRAR